MENRLVFYDTDVDAYVEVETERDPRAIVEKALAAEGVSFADKLLRGVPYSSLVESDLFTKNRMFFDYYISLTEGLFTVSHRKPSTEDWEIVYSGSAHGYVRGD